MTHEQDINCEVCKNPQGCDNLRKIKSIEDKGVPINGHLMRARQYFLGCPFLKERIEEMLSSSQTKSGGVGVDTLTFRKGK